MEKEQENPPEFPPTQAENSAAAEPVDSAGIWKLGIWKFPQELEGEGNGSQEDATILHMNGEKDSGDGELVSLRALTEYLAEVIT